VLVSTGTKNLQEQIFFKDLPTLTEALPVPFTATLMKGRSNYLCLHRFQSFEVDATNELFERPEKAVFLPVIQEWAKTTKTGDRAELRELPEDLPLWKEISAEADTCLGTECPRLLRHPDAPARCRIRRRHRQSPSAVRGCVGAQERVWRSDSFVRDAGRG
jgi:ATP-dependent DNA helicase DinG